MTKKKTETTRKAAPDRGNKTYVLIYPVEWGSKTITEITFARPKGKHIANMGQKLNLGELVEIAAGCVIDDLTPKFFENVDAADYLEIGGLMGDFLDVTRKIGKK